MQMLTNSAAVAAELEGLSSKFWFVCVCFHLRDSPPQGCPENGLRQGVVQGDVVDPRKFYHRRPYTNGENKQNQSQMERQGDTEETLANSSIKNRPSESKVQARKTRQ